MKTMSLINDNNEFSTKLLPETRTKRKQFIKNIYTNNTEMSAFSNFHKY